MMYFADHVATPAHKASVERHLIRQAQDLAWRQQFQQHRTPTPPANDLNVNHFFQDNEDPSHPDSIPPSPLTMLRSFIQTGSNDNDSDDLELDFDKLHEALIALEAFEDEPEDETAFDEELDGDIEGMIIEDTDDWYPFKKKEVRFLTFQINWELT